MSAAVNLPPDPTGRGWALPRHMLVNARKCACHSSLRCRDASRPVRVPEQRKGGA